MLSFLKSIKNIIIFHICRKWSYSSLVILPPTRVVLIYGAYQPDPFLFTIFFANLFSLQIQLVLQCPAHGKITKIQQLYRFFFKWICWNFIYYTFKIFRIIFGLLTFLSCKWRRYEIEDAFPVTRFNETNQDDFSDPPINAQRMLALEQALTVIDWDTRVCWRL